MPYYKLCPVGDITPGNFKTFSLLGKKIAIFNRNGELYAISAACRHQGADLTKGQQKGDVFTCPRHHWQYNLYTGARLSNKSLTLPKYALKVEDDTIYVDPHEDPFAY